MQQLISATVDPRLSGQCAGQALLAIPLAMRFMRAQMRRHRHQGLTVPQFRALIFVHHFPQATLSPMAEHIGLSLPAASRMVDLLVRRGLLLRRHDTRDRRCVRLALTARGRSLYQNAHRATQAALADRFETISERDLRTVSRALNLLTEAFGDHGRPTRTRRARKPGSRPRRSG